VFRPLNVPTPAAQTYSGRMMLAAGRLAGFGGGGVPLKPSGVNCAWVSVLYQFAIAYNWEDSPRLYVKRMDKPWRLVSGCNMMKASCRSTSQTRFGTEEFGPSAAITSFGTIAMDQLRQPADGSRKL